MKFSSAVWLHRALRCTVVMILCGMAAACAGRVMTGPTPTAPSLAVQLATPTVLPTLVLQVLTPVPTNTPAPTPTPTVHIIQPGDTLLGVALQYNVTLEELYQVNGVLKPELLQIGQPIIIPAPGSTGTVSQENPQVLLAPTQPPLPVKVEHAARYQTPVGTVWVLGEVANPTDQPVENVQVRVALLDAAGREVAVRTPFVAVDVIPSGQRAPFGVLFDDAPADAADFQAYAIRADQSYNHTARYTQLQPAEVQTAPEGTQQRVTGKVSNVGSTNAVGAHIVITLYDEQGRVTGFRQFSLSDEQLIAGGATTFDVLVSPDPAAQQVTNTAVIAQARTR